MHADNESRNSRIFRIGGKHALEPCSLFAIEQIGGRTVERYEIDAAALPMIVSVEAMIFCIVAKALLAYLGRVQPIGELDEIVASIFRRYQFVIADGKIYRGVGERFELALDEVIPGIFFVIDNQRRRGGKLFVVLIKVVYGAEIAEG